MADNDEVLVFKEFRRLLADAGYSYGMDAAENAFVGYQLARLQARASAAPAEPRCLTCGNVSLFPHRCPTAAAEVQFISGHVGAVGVLLRSLPIGTKLYASPPADERPPPEKELGESKKNQQNSGPEGGWAPVVEDRRCPAPWPGDDGTVAQCIGRGHCGCDECPRFGG